MVNRDQDRLVTVRELSSILSVGKSTIWAWVAAGRLPAPLRFGGRCTRWRLSEIQAVIGVPQE